MSGFRPSRAPARDIEASGFTRILSDLVGRIPGARASILVDVEGETVDYSGYVDPYDARLAAAHWHIVFCELRARRALGQVQWLIVQSTQRTFVVHDLPQRYALLTILLGAISATSSISSRAFDVCLRELKEEAGWPRDPSDARWFPADVVEGAPNHPRLLRLPPTAHETSLEILGTLVNMNEREHGYRVRLASGGEFTLVRERGGAWYSDEPPPNATNTLANTRKK